MFANAAAHHIVEGCPGRPKSSAFSMREHKRCDSWTARGEHERQEEGRKYVRSAMEYIEQ